MATLGYIVINLKKDSFLDYRTDEDSNQNSMPDKVALRCKRADFYQIPIERTRQMAGKGFITSAKNVVKNLKFTRKNPTEQGFFSIKNSKLNDKGIAVVVPWRRFYFRAAGAKKNERYFYAFPLVEL